MSEIEEKFNLLADAWLAETMYISSATEAVLSRPYLDIIGMGYPVVPLILKRLAKEGDEPNHWFPALSIITRENPIPEKARGNLRKMARIWIEWGKSRYGTTLIS